MVYYGALSKGCQRCRQRKVKCDLRKPECSKCEKSKKQCPGYRDLTNVVFRDESKHVIAKLRRLETIDKAPASATYRVWSMTLRNCVQADFGTSKALLSNLSLSVSSSIAVHELGASFFFNTYTSKDPPFYYKQYSWLVDLYSQQDCNGAVRAVIEAIGLSGLANVYNLKDLAHTASTRYSCAMVGLRKALHNVDTAASDETLMIVILLGLYQEVRVGDWNYYDDWTSHVHGATAILEHRGRENLFSERAAELYLQIRSQILAVCIMQRITVPAPLVQLMYTFESSGIRQQWRSQRVASPASMCEISFRLVNLYARAEGDEVTGTQAIHDAALDIETDLRDWRECLPPDWTYTCCDARLATSKGFGNIIHMYPSLWIAEAWNNWRVLRLLVNQILLQRNKQSTLPDEDHCLTPDTIIRQISADICITVGNFQRSPRIMSLIKPLYLVAIQSHNSDETRRFAVKQLRDINATMGIRQAGLLAETAFGHLEAAGRDFQAQPGTAL